MQFMIVPVWFFPEIMTSDNRSFWSFGYQSVWVTDTCIYRNPFMHTTKDKYDTLDYARMAKVVDGLYAIIAKEANNRL